MAVRRRTARTSSLEVTKAQVKKDGKTYRCVRRPMSVSDSGKWKIFYKDQWHEVLSRQIKMELNKLLDDNI